MTKVKLVGEDGNVFNLIGLVTKALKNDNRAEDAKKFQSEAFTAGSYDEVLKLISNYCDVE